MNYSLWEYKGNQTQSIKNLALSKRQRYSIRKNRCFIEKMQNSAYDCTVSHTISKTKHQVFKLALAPHCLSELFFIFFNFFNFLFFCMRQHPTQTLKAQLYLGLHFCLSKVALR